jgi:hypothetical protein
VVKIGLAYIDREIAQGRTIFPYPDWRRFVLRKNGMPYFADIFDEEAPRDYKKLFSPMMSSLFSLGLGRKQKLFELDETPEFFNLQTYLAANQDLRKHFLGGVGDLQNPDFLRMFKISVSLFAQYLIDRYVHSFDTTVYSEEQLLKVYGPMEIGIVKKNLPIEICVPILFVKFEGERVEIPPRAYVASMMPEFQMARGNLYKDSERVNESVADAAAQSCLNSFSCNTYVPPRKCCKQKTYGHS